MAQQRLGWFITRAGRQQILVGFHGKEGGGVGECLTKYPLPYAGFRKQTWLAEVMCQYSLNTSEHCAIGVPSPESHYLMSMI